MMFSADKRNELKNRLKNEEFDLAVIGGGITGAGIALDAATRGLSVALIEMQDFASGTSSRSTKLIHGGLRYLKNLEFRMVAEVGREREIVYENAPHVTEPNRLVLPFYKGGTFGPLTTAAALKVYDKLAGVKKGERRKMLSAEEAAEREPLLRKEGLKGAGTYVEYRTDDARLTIEVLKKAAEYGAVCLNYAAAEDFLYENAKVSGIEARDLVADEAFDIKAKVVVNAAGPWTDGLRQIDSAAAQKQIVWTKGSHIVVEQRDFPLHNPVYFDAPDGRMVFAIPRDTKIYIGTTDTFYEADLISPETDAEDIKYLIEAVKHQFPDVSLTVDQVESTWAGVRSLISEPNKGPSEISRKDEIWESENGLLSIAGGKLTGYRKMGETIVDRVDAALKKKGHKSVGKSRTKKLALSGGDFGGSRNFTKFVKSAALRGGEFNLPLHDARMFAQFFGTNAFKVFEIYRDLPASIEGNLPRTLAATVEYGIQEEMTYTPADFFVRRTGDLYFHLDDVLRFKEGVLAYMAARLGYSIEESERYRRELDDAIQVASRHRQGVSE
ncbi:glycerol-3-phosphate dehydrogenase/oxidase [Planomicrobium sp. YIM 101495]|uniref:glycerol-3-phosphate dehydrogenase/oxidase n=1 Tax=Planomicrobium sp. YIM 101495 TaxID=2665160 RepID=UPI0012B72DAD|nr:FAD-dependent oxidoreductase [Planomicrobium sp. YIM 101495]MTD30207.1 FAD-dependent oxidoreductase [Planomicrobium sp. YIM 101495]